jgi:rRNA maturation endonuclease Nob1
VSIVFILVAIGIVIFVGLPLFEARTGTRLWSHSGSNHRAQDLEERKEAIYTAIKDIEFDYQMGKLSEEDFKELRQQYKEDAMGLLKKIEQIQGKTVKATGIHAKKKRTKFDLREPNYCWICGITVTENDQFCANCGNKLK